MNLTGVSGTPLLAWSVFAVAALCTGCGEKSPREPEAARPSARADSSPGPQTLVGRWIRPDGGYVIRIARVAGDGTVEASYHNPSPINVERARTTTEGGALKLHLKLSDRGYPGCVYELEYDRENDVLFGTYFQAAMRRTYNVAFRRLE